MGEKRRGIIPCISGWVVRKPVSWISRVRGAGKRGKLAVGAAAVGSTSMVSVQSRNSSHQGNSSNPSSSTTTSSPTSSSSASSNTSSPPPKVPLKPASDVLAGALARAASQTTIHPLDTFKVRLQAKAATRASEAAASSASTSTSTSASGKLDLASLGKNVKTMYRGVFGAASGAGIAIGAYFAFYGAACNLITTHLDMSAGATAFTAGGLAAAGSSLVKVPLAVCIRSVQAGVYPNVFNAARTIVKATGPRGLFTGYLPTLMEDVPDMAIKFAAYESMRQLHTKILERPATVQEDFIMGATSGALAAATTTPLDVIKTNMMCAATSRPSMRSASAMVLAEGGPAAFFRGVGARAASNGINSAVFFCFFEAIRAAFAERATKQKAMMEIEPLIQQ